MNALQARKYLWVTYANDVHFDGAGSQLHKQYAVFALSKLLQLPYIHSPIVQINYQGLKALENNIGDSGLPDKYNQAHSLPHQVPGRQEFPIEKLYIEFLYPLLFLKTLLKARRKKKPLLLRIQHAHPIVDMVPHSLEVLKTASVSPYWEIRRPKTLQIVVHVRRGELYVVDSHRMLPNAYYITIAKAISEVLEARNIPYQVHLITEVANKPFEVTPDHHGIVKRIREKVTVDPSVNKIEEFGKEINNLQLHINTDPIDAMKKMGTADVLVISRSSFSYLPALLNPQAIVFHNPFWHPPMKDWIVTENNGYFNKIKFEKQLDTLIRQSFGREMPL